MELQNNELRIGNYIKFHNTITKVEGFSIWDNVIQSDNFSERQLKDFDPIPLTEEWLLKFGFKKGVFGFFEPKKRLLIEQGGSPIVYDNKLLNTKIKHVHQLQNLYFALTGTELTIKENE
jgi:hypothetical protein